jgi:uncharacterized membrane protein YccC
MTPRIRAWLASNRGRLWLGLRMIISALLAYGLALGFGLTQGYWAVLTTIIVTQNSVGGSLKAAIDRLVGSVCGALVGAVTAMVLPAHTPLAVGLALVVAVGPLAMLTAFAPNYRIAPITAIIVLMGTGAATLGPFGFALDRVLEITLGSVVGVVVSVLIVPARAEVQVRDAAGETASLLARIMTVLATAMGDGAPDLGTLPSQVEAALNRLGTAADEAARERRSRLSDQADLEPLFRTLRRLQQDILALHRLFGEGWPGPVQATLAPLWSAYANLVAEALQALAVALPARQEPSEQAALGTAIADFSTAVETMRRAGLTRTLPTDGVGRILGTVFRVEQLQRDLADLTERVREVAAHGRSRKS